MARKRTSTSKKPPEDRAASGSAYMTYVLLALTAVVVGLTVYVGVLRRDSQTPEPPGGTAVSQEEKVLARAAALMKAGAYGPARDLMLAQVRSNPRDVVVRPLLAEALWKLGQTAEAEHTVDDLLKLAKPRADWLWLKGELARMREFRDYSEALVSALWIPGVPLPDRPQPTYMHFFRQAAQAGADAGGEIWLKFALELLAADSVDLAGEKDLVGRKEEVAEEYLNKALGAGLRDARTLENLGKLALKREDFERAALMLSEATRHNPEDFRLWLMLAQAQKEAGQQDEAAKSVQKALSLHRSREALMLQGQIEQLRHRYAQAAEAYVQAAEDPRLCAMASYRAAWCYYLLEKYALAMKYIDLAADLVPEDAKVLELRTKVEKERYGQPENGSAQGSGPTPE